MSSHARGRPPIGEITAPQRRTLSELRRFINRRGFPQRSRNSPDILGISGPNVRDQVLQLVRKGYVNRESRKARGLTVLREPLDEVLALLAVPVVGSVAAVEPGPLLEDFRLHDQRVAELDPEHVVTADAARAGPVRRGESAATCGVLVCL